MADDVTRKQTTSEDDLIPIKMDDPLPPANDPGGAHGKGYSADPKPEPAVKDQDPVQLAPGPDTYPAVRQPEWEGKVQPTGRGDQNQGKGYAVNDRLRGADR